MEGRSVIEMWKAGEEVLIVNGGVCLVGWLASGHCTNGKARVTMAGRNIIDFAITLLHIIRC
jgi:hypothetical protein